MEHAGDIGEFPHDGEGVGVGLPIVDDHRQLKLPRQRQLAAEHLLLEFPRRVLLPVVIQPDLADGHHLGLLRQGTQGRQIVVGAAAAVLGMDAHRRVDVGVGPPPAPPLCGSW